MVIVTMSGAIIGEIQITKKDDHIERATFQLESTDLSSLPMRWTILASGNQAQRAVDLLKKGTKLCLCGRVRLHADRAAYGRRCLDCCKPI